MSDLTWLKELHAELWPPQPPRYDNRGRRVPVIKLEAKRQLSADEWQRVCRALVEHKLIAEMIVTNMFGGVGVVLYEHPVYPGLPAEGLITLTEEHLPGREPEPTGGCCSREAWQVFSEFTHTEQNLEWLKRYGLRLPQNPGYYDY